MLGEEGAPIEDGGGGIAGGGCTGFGFGGSGAGAACGSGCCTAAEYRIGWVAGGRGAAGFSILAIGGVTMVGGGFAARESEYILETEM